MRETFYATQSAYSEPGPQLDTLIRRGGEPNQIARWINSIMQQSSRPTIQE
jgi:hypothetical protein